MAPAVGDGPNFRKCLIMLAYFARCGRRIGGLCIFLYHRRSETKMVFDKCAGRELMKQAERNLLDRIDRWKVAFEDKENGIKAVLAEMVWDFAAFDMAAEIVRINYDEAPSRGRLNRTLFDLLRQGYWAKMLINSRRLLEAESLNGKYGVYSLRSVLNDVEAALPKLSRKIYVEHLCQAEYDLARLEHEQDMRLRAEGVVWGDPALTKSRYAHDNFDKICGICSTDRSSDDRPQLNFLSDVKSQINSLDDLVQYVNKRVAHSASIESRRGVSLPEFDLSKAKDALRVLFEAANYLGGLFANTGMGGLAYSFHDQFEGLDVAMVSNDQLNKLRERWARFEAEVHDWSVRPAQHVNLG